MSSFAVDPSTGELLRDASGSLSRVSGADEVVQDLYLAWQLVVGELSLDDPSAGLPIFELAQKGVPAQRVVQLLADQASKVPGVAALDFEEPELDHATRRMVVRFTGEVVLADTFRRVAVEGQTTVPIG